MGGELVEIIALQRFLRLPGFALLPDLIDGAAVIADQLARFRVKAQRTAASGAFLFMHLIQFRPPFLVIYSVFPL